MMVLLYKFYAKPIRAVFASFVTRRLRRSHSSISATTIALVSSVVVFMPLMTPAQSIFSDIYSPWCIALMLMRPEPDFGLHAFLSTAIVALFSSGVASIVERR